MNWSNAIYALLLIILIGLWCVIMSAQNTDIRALADKQTGEITHAISKIKLTPPDCPRPVTDSRKLELTYAIGMALGSLEGVYLQHPSPRLRLTIDKIKTLTERK